MDSGTVRNTDSESRVKRIDGCEQEANSSRRFNKTAIGFPSQKTASGKPIRRVLSKAKSTCSKAMTLLLENNFDILTKLFLEEYRNSIRK